MTTPLAGGAVAVLLAFALDRLVGEFPERVHPVALFGRCVAPLDRAWSRPRAVGALIALCPPVAAAAVVWATVALAAWLPSAAGAPPDLDATLPVLVAGIALFATTSTRMLVRTAREVIALAGSDLDAARSRLRALAGRDASDLSAGQVRSAAVESAAENLADGLVAPLSAFVVGAAVSSSLPVAAAAAAWVKAVNTLDSMFGYPDKPHGTASARLDDAVAFLPARASALLIALVAPAPGAPRRARAAARAPASPNSGWPMGTLAVALGVRLAKPGAYALNPSGRLPSAETAARGVRVVARAGLLAWALAAAALAVGALVCGAGLLPDGGPVTGGIRWS